MAFIYNGVSPTAIVYNGTSLNVLKYGTTNVWGKPFTLSITQGANTTITVNRTSSPNQRAATGNLSSGSLVYYGDIITVSVSVSSGFSLSSFTLNGSSWTSGNSHTVVGNVTIVSSAVASASWRTVWTGFQTIDAKNNTLQEKSGTFAGVIANFPTRLTGVAMTGNTAETSFNEKELFADYTEIVKAGTPFSIAQYAKKPTSANQIWFKVGGLGLYNVGVQIIKVQQYY